MEKKNIYKALFDFQQRCPIVYKATKNEFANYSYADLSTIIETIKPYLNDAGIGYTQLIEKDSIRTIIFHVESGESIESTIGLAVEPVQLKGMNQFQVEGSEITYKRRYALSSILGIVTDKDTDAAGEPVKTPQQPTVKKPAFDMVEFDKTRTIVMKYASDGETYENIEKRLLTKYSGIPPVVKTEIKKIVENANAS